MNLTYVIPCSGAKREQPAPAREFYTGQMFQHTLAAVLANAEHDLRAGHSVRILVLSAKLGLISIDAEVAPYEVKMGAQGSISVAELAQQAHELELDSEAYFDGQADVYALLPAAYFARLDAALRTLDVLPHDVYEVNAGIGDQRAINRNISA